VCGTLEFSEKPKTCNFFLKKNSSHPEGKIFRKNIFLQTVKKLKSKNPKMGPIFAEKKEKNNFGQNFS